MSFTVVGNYLIAGCVNTGQISVATDLNNIFTSGTGSSKWQNSASPTNYLSIATSADGTILAACSTTQIYLSINSGVSWSAQPSPSAPGPTSLNKIALSSDGMVIAVTNSSRGSLFYISTNRGLSWETPGLSSVGWTGITVSGDGTKIAVCGPNLVYNGVYDGSSWISSVWEVITGAGTNFYTSISYSKNSVKLYATTYTFLSGVGNIWVYNGSGQNWSAIGPVLINPSWYSITTNTDGSKIAAYLNTGAIYVSTNSGTSFSTNTTLSSLTGLCYSSDGTVLAACANTNRSIYVSDNDGVSFTEQTTAGTANWSAITVSGPIAGVCFRGSTRVVMGDLSFKAIKDIQRGEEVLIDKKTGVTKKVARVIRFMFSGSATRIPMHLIGNRRTIVCSSNHPFWVSDSRRILAGDIEGVEDIEICEVLYTIQFEEEGTYYVEGVKVDAVSPDHRKHKLPKELYFDQTKYNANRVIKSEDDQRRKKPNMTKLLF